MPDKNDPRLSSELSGSKQDPLSLEDMIPDTKSHLREKPPTIIMIQQQEEATPTLMERLRNLIVKMKSKLLK